MKKVVKLTESDLINIIKKVVRESKINEQKKPIIKDPIPMKGKSCSAGFYPCGGGCCPTSEGGAGFTSGCRNGQCYYTFTTTSEPTKF